MALENWSSQLRSAEVIGRSLPKGPSSFCLFDCKSSLKFARFCEFRQNSRRICLQTCPWTSYFLPRISTSLVTRPDWGFGTRRWPPSSAVCWQSNVLVKRSRNQFGDRCFATAEPTLWNSLPEQLRQPDITFGQFRRSLKTFCVWLAGPQRLVSER